MNSSQVKDEFLPMDERISSIYDGEYFRVMQRKGDILIVNIEEFLFLLVVYISAFLMYETFAIGTMHNLWTRCTTTPCVQTKQWQYTETYTTAS